MLPRWESTQFEMPLHFRFNSGSIGVMWLTFWLDVLVAVFGAVLTVAIAYGTFLLNLRRNEKLALGSLINEVHHRRTFSGHAVRVNGAVNSPDYRYANSSILSVRDEIRHTRDAVRGLPAIQEPLSMMTHACNRYLENAENDPDLYAFGLVTLREELMQQIERLATTRRGLHALWPGDGAFE